jgi:hypothetical protein
MIRPTEKRLPEQKPDSVFSYVANAFTLKCIDGWQDKTVYTLVGPVEDDIQHNVLINVEQDLPFGSVREYAEWQISSLEQELKSCRLLKKGSITLANGLPAYQAVFCWYPTDTLKVYQEQIFVLMDKNAYKLTATFTKKTRKTLGPKVERMMLSFDPVKPAAETVSGQKGHKP